MAKIHSRLLHRLALVAAVNTVTGLESASTHAANVQFLISDNETKDLERNGHLEPGSTFLRELKEAALNIGKRINQDVTFKVGVSVKYDFGGIARARIGQINYTTTTTVYDGKTAIIRRLPLVEGIEFSDSMPACSAHMEFDFDLHKLFDSAEFLSYYPPGTLRGTVFHEFMHGLGVESQRNQDLQYLESEPNGYRYNTQGQIEITPLDTLITRVEGDTPEFEVGGPNVKGIYGRGVRLTEYYGIQRFSHIGQSSPDTIRSDGLFIPNTKSSSLGPLGNIDVGVSVLSAGHVYHHPILPTAVDMALLKDLGYSMAPLNAMIYFNSNPRDEAFGHYITKTLYIPFLDLGDTTASIHMMWKNGNRFVVQGMATTGEMAILMLTGDAAAVMHSPAATLENGILKVPNIEVYTDGTVAHYAAVFAVAKDNVPMEFELVSLMPVESNTLSPSVEFVMCPN